MADFKNSIEKLIGLHVSASRGHLDQGVQQLVLISPLAVSADVYV
jgi:hypothetical protein